MILISGVAQAQLRSLIDQYVQFPTAGANQLFVGPIDITDCWVPQEVAPTVALGGGSDSLFVFKFSSTLFNTADSGDVKVDMAVSNQYCTPSKGFAGSVFDSLLAESDTCCTTSGAMLTDKYIQWFLIAASGPAIISANTDTIIVHTSTTGDRAEVTTAGRIITATPKKYAYFRYISGAANSAYNKSHNTVLVHETRENPRPRQ